MLRIDWREVCAVIEKRFHTTGLLAALLLVQACASFPDAAAPTHKPQLLPDQFTSYDGHQMAYRLWAAEAPIALVIALHGMNDYSNTFAGPAPVWAARGQISTYALDQRGFGNTPNFRQWYGHKTMMADLGAFTKAVRAKHPDTPVFLMGHSMGAGVVIAALADAKVEADGVILVAPGVWGGRAMPALYRFLVNLWGGVLPNHTATGERFGRIGSDNFEITREMFNDPLVIKRTRLNAAAGVTQLMGYAFNRIEGVSVPSLLLIGENDQIIPPKLQKQLPARLAGERTTIIYPNGWHLLLRDLQRERVWADIERWIAGQAKSQTHFAQSNNSSTVKQN